MGYNEETEEWDIPEERTTLWLAYSLARGRATHKMNWFFTMDECTDLLWDEDEDSV